MNKVNKNSHYLKEIKKNRDEFGKNNLRAVVGGGFAIDGFLGKLTREHEDLDFDIVGDLSWSEGFERTKKTLQKKYGNKLIEKNRRFEVIDGNYRMDFEYIQDLRTKNRYRYQFSTDCYEFPIPFYLYGKGKLRNIVFDIENPHYIFAIKFLMPISGEKQIRKRDKKDIENLIASLNKEDLIKVFHFQLDYIDSKIK